MKVLSFIFVVDFVILDYEFNFEFLIILEISFLSNGRTLVDIEREHMKFKMINKEVTFNICMSMKKKVIRNHYQR